LLLQLLRASRRNYKSKKQDAQRSHGESLLHHAASRKMPPGSNTGEKP
jgi:hypothetical protein